LRRRLHGEFSSGFDPDGIAALAELSHLNILQAIVENDISLPICGLLGDYWSV